MGKKILGCGAGIGVALVVLLAVAIGAVFLEEMGVPHKILVRIGALITIAGMAVGYRVSQMINTPKTDTAKSA